MVGRAGSKLWRSIPAVPQPIVVAGASESDARGGVLMTQGGTRIGAGRHMDPAALRRERDGVEFIHLPSAGRSGPPPAWPLSRPSARETKVWARQWARPQAIEWERHHQEEEVALYVRALVFAERPKASTSSRVLVARLMDALGISEAGLRAARWLIDEPEQAHEQAAAPESAPDEGVRARLKAVS